MTTDFALVGGLIAVLFAIPVYVSAYSDKRRPSLGRLLLLCGIGALIYATTQKQGGYEISEIPVVFLNVVAKILN